MMKFFLILLGMVVLVSAKTNTLFVVPANVAYANEDVADFATTVYDSVLNGIAEYNFTQTDPEKIYKVASGVVPIVENKEKIRSIHKELLQNKVDWSKHHFSKVILFDFSSKRADYLATKCQNKCSLSVHFLFVEPNISRVKKDLLLYYDATSALLDSASVLKLNNTIEKFLGNQ